MNYQELIKLSNGRITENDLKLLERACDCCAAKNIVEIGSADGGSSVILGLKAKENQGHLYCIEKNPKQRMLDNMKYYDLKNHFTLIPCPSPWVADISLPEKIDLLFIDGCHEVRWCLVDYHYFEPKVREYGVIVFHDTAGNCAEDKRREDYQKPGYTGLVQRAINIILETDSDKLVLIDQSDSFSGGAKAYQKVNRY